jgi:hypothetical protein
MRRIGNAAQTFCGALEMRRNRIAAQSNCGAKSLRGAED